jgi:hypothetical protein
MLNIEKRKARWKRYYQRRGKDRYKKPERKIYLSQWRKSHSNEFNRRTKKSRQSNFKNFIKLLLTRIRHHCKSRKKFKNSLNLEYMMKLLKLQNERCAITNLPLLHEFGKLQTISIDRIDSNKGYIPGNVQFVCKFVNLGKNSSTNDEVKQFFEDYKNL